MQTLEFDPRLLKSIGKDVILDPLISIKRPNLVSLGNRVAIDRGFYCTTALETGDYVHISPYVTCIGGQKGVFKIMGFNNIMAGARIICSSDRFDGTGLFGALIPEEYLGRQITAPVIMEPFSNIGTNAVVLPGTILRKGVLLTIGSVLMGDTEEWTVYKGNPAVPVKKVHNPKAIGYAKKLGYEF